MKMPNGFGTVYKLSGNRRKPWAARVTIGWDSDGQQIYQFIGYFEEKNEAIDALTKFRLNPVTPKANITLEDLYAEWSESKYQYIDKQTVGSYQSGWKHLSKFKKVTFKELRTAHFQSVIDGCHRAGMSRSSLSKIKIVAKMLYDYACENDISTKNYAKFLKIPKQVKEEKEAFSELEVERIRTAAADGTVAWADTILMMIYTGFRITEFLELTRFSVDFKEGIITGGIKTDAGKNRTVPIHPKILQYMKAWYERNGQTLICDQNGRKISARKFREEFYMPALAAIGVRQLNPHSTRHTFATLLNKAGADTHAIQKMIGHADYALTANTYTHVDVEELRKNIMKM